MKVIAVATTATLVCPAGTIGGHIFFNDSAETVYLSIDGSDPTTSTGIPILVGEKFFHEPVSFGPSGPPALKLIHGGAGTQNVRYGCTAFVAT